MEESQINPPPPLAAQILKVVGVLLLLTFLVDFCLLLIAPQLDNLQWQSTVMNQLIDRGVTPLLGFGLLYTGFWIETSARQNGSGLSKQATWQDWRFWTFVVSSLLGLLFLLLIPLYLGTTGQLADQAMAQINQQAIQAEVQIDQKQKQLKALAGNPQVEQLLKSNQLPPDQQAILQQLQQDPQALEKQAGQAREQIRTSQNQALEQTRRETLLGRLRGSLRSFLLATGFITIGWGGLRESR